MVNNNNMAILFLFILLSLCQSGLSCSSTNCRGRMLLVRPFTTHDVDKLLTSFDSWLPPCSSNNTNVDLALFHSQTLQQSSTIFKHAIANMITMYETKWQGCFGRLIVEGVDIAPQDDVYDLTSERADWVSGPNRQFERMVRRVQGNYETMFLMESDSVPMKANWLDALTLEVEAQRPFAIIGSSYRGDKWDAFYGQVPRSLVNHLNGNAVYNVSHVVVDSIVTQLESEAATTGNAIPYDYRIGQIVEEAKSHIPTIFPNFDLASPEQTEFLNFLRNQPLRELIKETKLIGNYAATNMVEEYLSGDEVIVHGATMYSSWNTSKMGELTLLVSDWAGDDYETLLSHLDDTSHPFDQVLLIVPPGVNVDIPSSLRTPLQVLHRMENQDSSFDMCFAQIATPWFMTTDALHRVKPNTHLMTTQDGKVVAVYAGPKESQCLSDPVCSLDLSLANEICSDTVDVFRNHDFVFHTPQVDAYCNLWITDFSTMNGTPSATSFAAFLEATEQTDSLYHFVDRMRYGSRDVFMPVVKKMSRHGRMLQSTNVTVTSCTIQTTQESCLLQDCEWRPSFGTCRIFYREATGDDETANRSESSSNADISDGVPVRSRAAWAFIIIGISSGAIAVLAIAAFSGHQVAVKQAAAASIVAVPGDDDDMMADIAAPDLLDSANDDLSQSTPDGVLPLSAFLTNPPTGYHYDESWESIELVRDGPVIEIE